MNTEVYLIRHGEILNPSNKVYGSSIDVPLSPEGIEQIKFLANEFKKEGIVPDIIYSSFHTRGIRSAEVFKEVLAPNIELRQDNRLRDMDHPGLEKYSVPYIFGIDDIWNYKWPPEDKNIPLEKREDMIERMAAVIGDIVKANAGKTVFVIVHGHPSAFYMWSLLNPKEKFIPLPSELIKNRFYLKKAEPRKLVFEGSRLKKYEISF